MRSGKISPNFQKFLKRGPNRWPLTKAEQKRYRGWEFTIIQDRNKSGKLQESGKIVYREKIFDAKTKKPVSRSLEKLRTIRNLYRHKSLTTKLVK